MIDITRYGRNLDLMDIQNSFDEAGIPHNSLSTWGGLLFTHGDDGDLAPLSQVAVDFMRTWEPPLPVPSKNEVLVELLDTMAPSDLDVFLLVEILREALAP